MSRCDTSYSLVFSVFHLLSPHPSFSSQTSTASPQQTGVKVRMLIYGPEHFNIVAPKYPTTVYHQAVFENFKHSPLLFRFWGCFFVCFVLFWQVITHMQFRFWQFICLFVLFWQVITHMFKSSAHQHFQAQKLRTKQNALIWWSHCKNTKIILKYCTKYPTSTTKLMAQNIA